MLQKHRTFHLRRGRKGEKKKRRKKEKKKRRKDKLELLHKFYSQQYCFVWQARLATLARSISHLLLLLETLEMLYIYMVSIVEVLGLELQ